MADALDRFYIDGIQHNVPFLASIMGNARWRSGELSTSFIDDEFPGGFTGEGASDDVKSTLAAVAVVLDHTENERKRLITDQMSGKLVNFNAERSVKLGDEWFDIAIERSASSDGSLKLKAGGSEAQQTVKSDWVPGKPIWNGTIDETRVSVQVRRVMNGYKLAHRGIEIEGSCLHPA